MRLLFTQPLDAMRTFYLALLAGAFLLATQSATAQQTYCLIDEFSTVTEVVADGPIGGPTGLLQGTSDIFGVAIFDFVGGRGRSGMTVRHHNFVYINPDLSNDPGCSDGTGLADWVSYNGTVTGGSAPYGFAGDFANSCGARGPVTGTITVGTCPAPRPSEPTPDSPMRATEPVEVERGGSVYCFDDGTAFWEVFPEGPVGGPSGIITGTNSILGDAIGGRGRSGATVRHHSLTAINPTLSDDPGCLGGDEFVDWISFNGKVTGGSSPFTFSGDLVNSCGAILPFSGPLTAGACPVPREREVQPGSPYAGIASAEAQVAAAATAEALGVSVHPNPATDEARIAYTLEAATDVRLVVYDVLGRQVATLVDGPQEAGAHTAVFDARGLAGGVYVWHLVAGEQVTAGQLSLTR